MLSTSCRYLFDSIGSAAEALDTVLGDARKTTDFYTFGGLTAQSVLTSGLLLEGQLEGITPKLDKIAGAVRYDD